MTHPPASADLATSSGAPLDPPATARPRLLALIVASALFMQALDATIITTALPKMALSFGVAPSDLSIGITSYLLAMAAILPLSGWVANRFGPRNVFVAAIVVFTLASVLCALAPTLWAFTAARVLQGVGGSLVGPVGRLVALKNTSKKDLLAAVALMVWPSLAAPVIGPALGGFIVTYASWPWIFLVNLPIGLVGLVMVFHFIPNERERRQGPFDHVGFLIASVSLICMVGGLELFTQARMVPVAALVTGAGVALAALSVRRFARHPHPLIPLDALKLRTFTVASLWGGTAFRMAIFGAPFLLPLMFQVGFGFTPIHSGLLLLLLFAGNLVMKPFTTPILRLLGLRIVVTVNGTLAALSLAACGLFTATTPFPIMAAVLFFGGGFRSLQFTCLDSLTYADIPPSQRAGATTLSGVTSQVAAVLGVAVSAILLAGFQRLRGGETAAVGDFRLAFFGLAAVGLTALPDYLSLPRDAGAEVTGHRRLSG